MKNISLKEIKKAASASLIRGDLNKNIKEIKIDSREIESGDLFIAIIGENQDGHIFLKSAVENGAAAVIVSREVELPEDVSILKVNDTTRSLQDIAGYYRRKYKDLKVIAITGSAGKTTTKDMISAVLSEKFSTLKTEGNYNNHIGLPLTLLKLNGSEDFAVLEMGMSGFGEIKLLSEIALPDAGIITNVGAAHLEQLGSLENIAKAKKELVDSLDESAAAFLNYDNKFCRKMGSDFEGRIIYFGFEKGADLRVRDYKFNKNQLRQDFKLEYKNKFYDFYIKKPGKHNIYNALSAVGVGFEYNMEAEDIQKGLLEAEFTALRMETIRLDNQRVLINDCYNANPLSVRAAVDVLSDFPGKRKIAVLASMLELGKESKAAHKNIGNYIYEKNIDILLTVGKKAEMIAAGAEDSGMNSKKIFSFNSNNEAAEFLMSESREKDIILIKGSRANEMEKISEKLISKGSSN
ncbi:MAG: UDP-N-acetylmuramoyl-tripeptide--D-alanyl-D-alanine ligase [Halanaerobium sp.]